MKRLVLLAFALSCSAFAQTPHTAAWTINTPTCTTTTACTAQIWRVVIPAGGTCPGAGDAAYINVQSALPGTTITATQTTWNYVDSGASLVSGATYCGYATYTTAGGAPSLASAIFQSKIPTPVVLPAPGIAVTLK